MFTCGFLNIAHRGDNEQGKFAEHSWVAYDRAVCAKVDYLELDLQQTADNVLVVSHDENLSRVFGIDKSIANLSYHDLITYKNQNGESIHRLADVFQRYHSSNVKFMIEPKDSSDNEINNLLSLIKKYHLQNIVLAYWQLLGFLPLSYLPWELRRLRLCRKGRRSCMLRRSP